MTQSPSLGIDEELIFQPLRIAVLTISDTRTSADDRSGDTLTERVISTGHVLSAREIVRDKVEAIKTRVLAWSEDESIDVIITTGGTGLTGHDVTVEAIAPLFDKTLDGFSALFHQLSFKSIGLSTLQSRACAGLINQTFVFCLPGSTGAVRDGWDHIISGSLDSRYCPSSLVDLLPRLKE